MEHELLIGRTESIVPPALHRNLGELAVENEVTVQDASVKYLRGSIIPGIKRRLVIPDISWQEYANCLGVDPDLFFPERGASTREAKAVCRGCVVRSDCLEFALVNDERFGIWGGMSEIERRRIRRQRSAERQRSNGAAPISGE